MDKISSKRGFTVAEVVTASFISLYVIAAAWLVYLMTWNWWHEIAPTVEAQRIARTAIMAVTEGFRDPTAGTETVGATTYGRRDGIDWTTLTNDNPTPVSPVITNAGRRIDFRLEPDTANVRSYYLGVDANGVKSVYYINSNGVTSKLKGTDGITDLLFSQVSGYSNIYKVTATIQKTVVGTRRTPYGVNIEYSDYIYMRNL